jgi:ABC-2 type transport system permease protein
MTSDRSAGITTDRPPNRARMPSLAGSAARICELSFGQMLWSVRSVFLAVLLGGPVVVALVIRIVQFAAPRPISDARIDGPMVFGLIIWILYVRIIVPILGVFYGTSLLADEVEDKTITYLFTRPVPRPAVLLGKYLAYLLCTGLLVVPSVVVVYFLVAPLGSGTIGASFPALLKDLGMLAAGLFSYGAVFAWVGARLKRPLVLGLVFAFAWEPTVLLVPGFLKRATIGFYLQALVPHAMPPESGLSYFMRAVQEVPSAAASLGMLAIIALVALWSAARAVETREYVLEE